VTEAENQRLTQLEARVQRLERQMMAMARAARRGAALMREQLVVREMDIVDDHFE
jgi:hypothetical protein